MWFRENWFKLLLLILSALFVALFAFSVWNEHKVNRLNKWGSLCEISREEAEVRFALGLKFGQKETDWCRNTFYGFFK